MLGRHASVGRGGHDLDGRDEPIPFAGNRLHERRGIRRIAKSLPDLADRGVDAGLDVHEHVLAPEPIDDVAAGDELTAALDQQDQEVHRLPPELDRPALPAQLVTRDIELEVAEAENLSRFQGLHRARPDPLQCHKAGWKSCLVCHLAFQKDSTFC